jgi:predicted dehydrogenase
MKRALNVGLIGHKFMGKAHSHALRDVTMFFDLDAVPVMRVLCGVEDDLEDAARRYGWHTFTPSWEEVVNNPEIDIVDIATPGNTHWQIALAAAQQGKHILCEKPLALTPHEAKEMYDAAEEAHVKHVVNFNYRRLPAVALAKKLIDEGELGAIYHFRGTYQQDWPLDPNFPFIWRMDKTIAGAGSMADKGSHVVDLARYLVDEFEEVACSSAIFVKERSLPDQIHSRRQVTTDDAAVFIARFHNGTLGVFETSRMSAGHKNALAFEVNGSKGSVVFDLERLNELKLYTTSYPRDTSGFRTIMVTEPCHQYVRSWWPPGHVLGWEHTFVHQYYEFLQAIARDSPSSPSFYDGLRNQEVLAAIEAAAVEKCWVRVGQSRGDA